MVAQNFKAPFTDNERIANATFGAKNKSLIRREQLNRYKNEGYYLLLLARYTVQGREQRRCRSDCFGIITGAICAEKRPSRLVPASIEKRGGKAMPEGAMMLGAAGVEGRIRMGSKRSIYFYEVERLLDEDGDWMLTNVVYQYPTLFLILFPPSFGFGPHRTSGCTSCWSSVIMSRPSMLRSRRDLSLSIGLELLTARVR